MELYHFTAERFVSPILKQGITRGVMVKTFKPLTFLFNKQWLTKNPYFKQDWAIGSGILPYKRNEVRLTVKIPFENYDLCKPWTQMQFLTPDVAKQLSAYGDPENWWIYQGEIPPKWIVKVTKSEKCSTPKCHNAVDPTIQSFCDDHGGVIGAI